ncbi:MAG TPA: PIN domain-containing protein [Caulobacteraceae bacterium]|nr:PIN domain-containing protein [Caulobacteraceae bacterium]
MSRYMLDANAISASVRGLGGVRARMRATAPADLTASAIAEAEVLYGLARRPEARRLGEAVRAVLEALTILPWTSAAAEAYGPLRAGLEQAGRSIGALDMLIAAHAIAEEAVLVTSDKGFGRIPGLMTEDWAAG